MTSIEVVTAYFIDPSQGDIRKAFIRFSQDAKWYQLGNHHFSGTIKGIDAVGKMLGATQNI